MGLKMRRFFFFLTIMFYLKFLEIIHPLLFIIPDSSIASQTLLLERAVCLNSGFLQNNTGWESEPRDASGGVRIRVKFSDEESVNKKDYQVCVCIDIGYRVYVYKKST